MNIFRYISPHFLSGPRHVYDRIRLHSFSLSNLSIDPLPFKHIPIFRDKLLDLEFDWILTKSMTDLDEFYFGRLPFHHVSHSHIVPSLGPSQARSIPLTEQYCISNLITKARELVHLLIYGFCASLAGPERVGMINVTLIDQSVSSR
jgi:hypothetical protein